MDVRASLVAARLGASRGGETGSQARCSLSGSQKTTTKKTDGTCFNPREKYGGLPLTNVMISTTSPRDTPRCTGWLKFLGSTLHNVIWRAPALRMPGLRFLSLLPPSKAPGAVQGHRACAWHGCLRCKWEHRGRAPSKASQGSTETRRATKTSKTCIRGGVTVDVFRDCISHVAKGGPPTSSTWYSITHGLWWASPSTIRRGVCQGRLTVATTQYLRMLADRDEKSIGS